MKRALPLAAAAILVTGFGIALPSDVSGDELELAKIHQKIARRYDKVEHISSAELNRALASTHQAEDIILFDVREVEEHAVSHIGHATQVEPGIWTSTFLRAHANKIKGKTVVFYCSVGQRSSYAASYLQKALKKNGATRVLNLKGGIFSWHNQRRPVNLGQSRTPYVHPFNAHWGRLILRQKLTRLTPSKGPVSSETAAPTSDAAPKPQ